MVLIFFYFFFMFSCHCTDTEQKEMQLNQAYFLLFGLLLKMFNSLLDFTAC